MNCIVINHTSVSASVVYVQNEHSAIGSLRMRLGGKQRLDRKAKSTISHPILLAFHRWNEKMRTNLNEFVAGEGLYTQRDINASKKIML